jgi:hypothetical protein
LPWAKWHALKSVHIYRHMRYLVCILIKNLVSV